MMHFRGTLCVEVQEKQPQTVTPLHFWYSGSLIPNPSPLDPGVSWWVSGNSSPGELAYIVLREDKRSTISERKDHFSHSSWPLAYQGKSVPRRLRPQLLSSQSVVRLKNEMRWSEGTLPQKYYCLFRMYMTLCHNNKTRMWSPGERLGSLQHFTHPTAFCSQEQLRTSVNHWTCQIQR
jgi:hypothetical protein